MILMAMRLLTRVGFAFWRLVCGAIDFTQKYCLALVCMRSNYINNVLTLTMAADYWCL
jgi:hypothetical protein